MRWVFFLVLVFSAPAYAVEWMIFEDSRVVSIVEWQSDNPVFVEMRSGTYCYIPAGEKNLIALVYSLHASGKVADVHCNPDDKVTVGGLNGYRVHRVVAK